MKATLIYPRLLRRIQALLINGVVVPVAVIGTLVTASNFGVQGVYSAILAGLVIFIFEPLFVSTTGGTIGHHLIGIQVKSKKTKKNLNIASALVRFIAKIMLGLVSLITVFTTKQHQAIHDVLVGSIVIFKNIESTPNHEILYEREAEESGYSYPSKPRRVIMILLYNIVLSIALGTILILTISEPCISNNLCSNLDEVFAFGWQTLWFACFIASVVLCWKGRLFGCRRLLIK